MTDTPRPDVKALLDALLPGSGDWPAAGAVVNPQFLPPAALDLARDLADLSHDARTVALEAFEAARPSAFADIYFAVADAYYATPEAAHVLRDRAASGPPDTSGPPFDRALLDGVVSEQRGKRRL